MSVGKTCKANLAGAPIHLRLHNYKLNYSITDSNIMLADDNGAAHEVREFKQSQ